MSKKLKSIGGIGGKVFADVTAGKRSRPRNRRVSLRLDSTAYEQLHELCKSVGGVSVAEIISGLMKSVIAGVSWEDSPT